MARERNLKRIVGLDRSGGPPGPTRRDQPWRPWTIPNAICLVRALLIPVFFVLAWNSPDGRDATANIAILICGLGDYLDGLAARMTGQYSRLGTLLDPLIDRILIVAVALVIFKFELLPRYLVVLVLARELLMLCVSVPALLRGLELRVNWVGRLSVWPLMLGAFIALWGDTWVAEALVWIGTAGAYWASWLYFRDALRQRKGATEPADAKPQAKVEP